MEEIMELVRRYGEGEVGLGDVRMALVLLLEQTREAQREQDHWAERDAYERAQLGGGE